MTRVYTPIHADKALNDEWWVAKGYVLGVNVWYNAIRDGSGNFTGYFVKPDGKSYSESVCVFTVAEAEAAINPSN